MKEVCCYMGHKYLDETMLDYNPFTCYYEMIESVMEND